MAIAPKVTPQAILRISIRVSHVTRRGLEQPYSPQRVLYVSDICRGCCCCCLGTHVRDLTAAGIFTVPHSHFCELTLPIDRS